jgi:RimJ/RimL family protein N-acetyltransferase
VPRPFPLMSRRVMLRPLEPGDAEAVVRYRSHPIVRRFQSWGTDRDQVVAQARDQAEAPLQPGSWYQLAIVERGTGAVVGDIGLRPLGPGEPTTAELGITIDPDFQRQGLAREATRLLTTGARELMRLSGIRAHTEPDNQACIGLLEGLGFELVRVERGQREVDGRLVDDRVYELAG